MASGASAHLESAILTQYLITNAAYISLHTGSASGGLNEVSTTATGYARQPIPFTLSGSEPTQAQNNALVQFPTAAAAWGTVSAIGIWDAVGVGNLLFYGDISTPKAIGIGDVARFDVNTVTIIAN